MNADDWVDGIDGVFADETLVGAGEGDHFVGTVDGFEPVDHLLEGWGEATVRVSYLA